MAIFHWLVYVCCDEKHRNRVTNDDILLFHDGILQKLSVPYMRSSGSKKRSRTTQEVCSRLPHDINNCRSIIITSVEVEYTSQRLMSCHVSVHKVNSVRKTIQFIHPCILFGLSFKDTHFHSILTTCYPPLFLGIEWGGKARSEESRALPGALGLHIIHDNNGARSLVGSHIWGKWLSVCTHSMGRSCSTRFRASNSSSGETKKRTLHVPPPPFSWGHPVWTCNGDTYVWYESKEQINSFSL